MGEQETRFHSNQIFTSISIEQLTLNMFKPAGAPQRQTGLKTFLRSWLHSCRPTKNTFEWKRKLQYSWVS